MKELIIQLKALGVIRFILYYFLVALEFILNLPYMFVRLIYMKINLVLKKADRIFKKERVILLLKNKIIRNFLYKCKEDYKHYIKEMQD